MDGLSALELLPGPFGSVASAQAFLYRLLWPTFRPDTSVLAFRPRFLWSAFDPGASALAFMDGPSAQAPLICLSAPALLLGISDDPDLLPGLFCSGFCSRPFDPGFSVQAFSPGSSVLAFLPRHLCPSSSAPAFLPGISATALLPGVSGLDPPLRLFGSGSFSAARLPLRRGCIPAVPDGFGPRESGCPGPSFEELLSDPLRRRPGFLRRASECGGVLCAKKAGGKSSGLFFALSALQKRLPP